MTCYQINNSILGTSAKKTTTPGVFRPVSKTATAAKPVSKNTSANIIKTDNNGTVSCNTYCTGSYSGARKGIASRLQTR